MTTLKDIYAKVAAGELSPQDALVQVKQLHQPAPPVLKLETFTWQPIASTQVEPWQLSSQRLLLCDLPHLNAQQVQAMISGCQVQISRSDHAGEGDVPDWASRYLYHSQQCLLWLQTLMQEARHEQVVLRVIYPDSADGAWLSGLAAMLKTATLENPMLVTQLLCIAPDCDVQQLASLLKAEGSTPQDHQVRWSSNQRQVWQRAALSVPTAPLTVQYKEGSCYLITGGSGALAQMFAADILDKTTDTTVLLVGRRSLDPVLATRIKNLHPDQARVRYLQADISIKAEVAALFTQQNAQLQKLTGIIHCAGCRKDQLILHKNVDDLKQVFAPKVQGTLWLDEFSKSLPLDLFVCFSSVAAVLGNTGQADYATANAFMDGFISQRAALVRQGLRQGVSLAINWPYWANGGMQLDSFELEMLTRQSGMLPLSTKLGIQAFTTALACAATHVLVSYSKAALGDGRTVLQEPARMLAGSHPKTISTPARDDSRSIAKPATGARPSSTCSLDAAIPEAEIARQFLDFIVSKVAGLLKMAAEKIDVEASLEHYGIDSIMAVKLTHVLEESFGPLSKTLFFEYRNIAELTAYLSQRFHDKRETLLGIQPMAAEPTAIVAVSSTSKGADASGFGASPTEPQVLAVKGRHQPHQLAPSVLPQPSATTPKVTQPNFGLQPQDEAIAIIGIAGRYPQSDDLAAFWQNLVQGVDCITEVPAARWNWQEWQQPELDEKIRHRSQWGGFISGVSHFDALFFNISPLEAAQLDPQERLFLQTSWQALEDAGLNKKSLQQPNSHGDLAGQVGVYAGVMYGEYRRAGTLANVANRVSYVLDIHGPSLTLETMCSSSLTAIHLACQDLRLGRTTAAIAGGVNVSISPGKYSMLSASRFIAIEGQCQSFGEGGDGYIPAEGVGVVILKRLSAALADRHHIYALITGSAINHGGHTHGYTVPNPTAQADVIQQAIRQAGIKPEQISYIEAHGTGTKLGDPIEVAGLTKAFALSSEQAGSCALGSVKSNIGHAESAAAVAGLSKIILQLQHGQLVPSLHASKLNPYIDFQSTPFFVNQQLRPWQRPVLAGKEQPRIAGLSSFGAGGSNGHLIVEEYRQPSRAMFQARTPTLVILSARTLSQLQQKVVDLSHFIQQNHDLQLADIGFTLQVGREAMRFRLAILVESLTELQHKLQCWHPDEAASGIWYADSKETSKNAQLNIDVEQALLQAQLHLLASAWCQGIAIDWQSALLPQQFQRISLPTYPFAQDHYWQDEAPLLTTAASVLENTAANDHTVAKNSVAAPCTVAALHPLLHANTSTLDLQRYSSDFSQGDFSEYGVLSGTGESKQTVLSHAALLEMMVTACDLSFHSPNSVHWQQFQFGPAFGQGVLHVALQRLDAEQLLVEIYSETAEGTCIHAQARGRLETALAQRSSPMPLAWSGPSRQLTAADFYQQLVQQGIQVTAQCVQLVQVGDAQWIADIGFEPQAKPTLALLLDSALQTVQTLLPIPAASFPQTVTGFYAQAFSGKVLNGQSCVDQHYQVRGQLKSRHRTELLSDDIPQLHETAVVHLQIIDEQQQCWLELLEVEFEWFTPIFSQGLDAGSSQPPNVQPQSYAEDALTSQPQRLASQSTGVAAVSRREVTLSTNTQQGFARTKSVAQLPVSNLTKPVLSLLPVSLMQKDVLAPKSLQAKPRWQLPTFATSNVGEVTFGEATRIANPYLPIQLFDLGDGLYEAVLSGDLLAEPQIHGLSAVLTKLAQQPTAKVLILDFNCRGGVDSLDLMLKQALLTQMLEHQVAIIARVREQAIGTGWVLAAACDLILLAPQCHVGLFDPAQQALPLPMLEGFFAARFGLPQLSQSLYHSRVLRGQELSGDTALAKILAPDQLVSGSVLLGQRLASGDQTAIQLLKSHLVSELAEQVSILSTAGLATALARTGLPIATPQCISAQSLSEALVQVPAWLQIREHANCCQINMTLDVAGIGVDQRLSALTHVLAQLQQRAEQMPSSNKPVLISSDRADFWPEQPVMSSWQAVLIALGQQIQRCAFPVIVACDSEAQGLSLLLALYADFCVLHAERGYCVGELSQPWLSTLFAQSIQQRFGADHTVSLLWLQEIKSGQQLAPISASKEPRQAAIALATLLNQSVNSLTQCGQPYDWRDSVLRQWSLPSMQDNGDVPDASAPKVASIALHDLSSYSNDVLDLAWDDNGVVIVTMQDKTAKNMFSDALVQALEQAFTAFAQCEAVKVVILTGYDQYFSAGGTKQNLIDIAHGKAKFTDVQTFSLPLRCDIPVIAAMQGHSIGAGWALGMFADITLFSRQSQYLSPYMRYGFTPGAGATLIMPEKLGTALARESLFTACEYRGQELQQLSTQLRVQPKALILAHALDIAKQLATWPQAQLKHMKQQKCGRLVEQLPTVLALELQMHERSFVGQVQALERIEQSFQVFAQQMTDSEAKELTLVVQPNAVIATPRKAALPALARPDRSLLLQKLTELLASELHIQSAEIDLDTQFIDLGVDSITGVTWIRQINDWLGTDIEATVVYSYPTLLALADFLHVHLATTKVSSAATDTMKSAAVMLSPPHDASTLQVSTQRTTPPAEHQLDRLQAQLKAWLAAELHLAQEEISADTAFVELGLDSITGVTWLRQINQHYALDIAATELYSYPTLAEFSQFLQPQLSTLAPADDLEHPQTATEQATVQPWQPCGVVAGHAAQLKKPVRILTSGLKFTAGKAQTEIKPSAPSAIAIIGMAGQFPGAADVQQYWHNIANSVDSVTELDDSRWPMSQLYQEGEPTAGKTYGKWLGQLADYDKFDPLFFNIAPAEAECMEPQQRLMLETCWNAIEDAAYNADHFKGSLCGVYIGCAGGDYYNHAVQSQVSAQGFTGDAASILAGRISYHLNLQGASLSIDTACSSSLVAIALACESLSQQTIDLALAGGVYVMAGPEMLIKTSQSGMLSAQGKCFAFDQRANGFVPGEAVGAVLLKRLADAQRDQDLIYAIIEGWGTNQDGKTNGITAPNPQAQSRLLQAVYRRFKLDPSQIQLLEAHGTGTKLGDPVEIDGLRQAFSAFTEARHFCAIGSVKSNIGHTLTAAGVASVIKVAKALEQQQLPPTLHFSQLNEHIRLQDSAFYVNHRLQPWPTSEQGQRLAAVSSFGFSGTNAHLVLREYVAPTFGSEPPQHQAGQPLIFVLSARTPGQLVQRADAIRSLVRSWQQPCQRLLAALSYTLQLGRQSMEYRLAIVADAADDLSAQLEDFVQGRHRNQRWIAGKTDSHHSEVALLEQDEHLKASLLQHWLRDGSYQLWLTYWTKGMTVNWQQLWPKAPIRLRLPGYPFNKTRFWLPAETEKVSAVIHPLVQRNISDLAGQKYQTKFTAAEQMLVQHHAGAVVEMLLAAVQAALPKSALDQHIRLNQLEWHQPTKPLSIDTQWHIELSVLGEQSLALDVLLVQEAQSQLYVQGLVLLAPPEPVTAIDVAALQQRLRIQALPLQPIPIPRLRSNVSIDIRQLHQAQRSLLVELWCHEPTASAVLRLADVLLLAQHLAVTTFNLNTWGELLPSAVQSVIALQPCVPHLYALIELTHDVNPNLSTMATAGLAPQLDINLFDAAGTPILSLQGLTLSVNDTAAFDNLYGGATAAVVEGSHSAETATFVASCQLQLLSEQEGKRMQSPHDWHLLRSQGAAQWLVASDVQQQAVAVVTLPGLGSPYDVAQQYQHGAVALFEYIKGLLSRGLSRPTVVQVLMTAQEAPLLAGLGAILDTAHRENPNLIGQLVITDADAVVAQQQSLFARASAFNGTLRYQQGQCYRSEWLLRPLRPVAEHQLFKEGGTYLITGGLGALGKIFCREILTKTQNASVILTGRAAWSAAIAADLEAISSQAERLAYRQLDLTDAAACLDFAAQCPNMTGIIHAAGAVADQYIRSKSTAEFSAVLAPKVAGTWALDQAFAKAPLDFFVLFSSIAGAVGNAGQVDYACANRFIDQFAAYRQQQVQQGLRQGKTVAINWPLWAEGGMRPDAATEQMLLQATSMQPMTTTTGLACFYQALVAESTQLMFLTGNKAALQSWINASTMSVVASQDSRHVLAPQPVDWTRTDVLADGTSVDAVVLPAVVLVEKTQIWLAGVLSEHLKLPVSAIDSNAALEKYGINSVMALALTSKLERQLGPLSKTLFYEYQSLAALATYLSEAYATVLATLLGQPLEHSRNANHNSMTSHVTASLLAPTPIQQRSAARFSSSHLMAAASTARLGRVGRGKPEPDPIAVIGMSGRFPQAYDVHAYWQNLLVGKNCIEEVPAARWDLRQWYCEDSKVTGFHHSKWGGFIQDADRFDPLFFNISPREAEQMDPQERLFLEHSWAALEDAGLTRERLQQTDNDGLPAQVGVYVGVTYNEYKISGSLASIANRVSYLLNLHGPSMQLDTMCSSSLTSVHLACEDLRSGRTQAAIAGGVNLSINPSKYQMLSAGRFISAQGQCKSFGEGGDGYIPAEGVGVLVLKRLSDAQQDHHHIYGLIIGSAVNHGGKTNGYSVPNPLAQADVVRRAMRQAGVTAPQISYIEAHGTGTSLGDPIEITGLTRVFAEQTAEKGFCLLGSVKSNIGHCEAAAGVSGLMKLMLQLKHQTLVASLHAATLNPNIDFANTPFAVVQQTQPWQRPVIAGKEQPRIAGISSFGAGGSNAHLLVQEFQPQPVSKQRLPQQHNQTSLLIPLSAATAEQLTQQAQRLLAVLADFPDTPTVLQQVAYTLQIGREAMTHRLGFVVTSVSQLSDKLTAWLAGERQDPQMKMDIVLDKGEYMALFSQDAEMRGLVQGWMQQQKWQQLLNVWVKGLRLDWQEFYLQDAPGLLSLPTYPFARDRFWVEPIQPPTPHQIGSEPSTADQQTHLQGFQWVIEQLAAQTLDVDDALVRLQQQL